MARDFYEERRLRLYAIPDRLLLNLLNWGNSAPDCIFIPKKVEALPEGCKFYGPHYDVRRQAYLMVVGHESFDIIPQENELPVYPKFDVDWISYKLVKE